MAEKNGPLRCQSCGQTPEDHSGSVAGPMTVCPLRPFIRCLSHHQLEPCTTCAAYIAGGL